MKWRIYWSLNDCGNEVIEAETEIEAIEKFRELSLVDLVGTNENIADIGRIHEAIDHRPEVRQWK